MQLLKKFWVTVTTFVLVILGVFFAVTVKPKPSAEDAEDAEDEAADEDEGEADQAEAAPDGDGQEQDSGCEGVGDGEPPDSGEDCGDPVDIVLGCVHFDFIDFEYPGAIPFSWARSWSSRNKNPSALGYGSGSLYTMQIHHRENIIFINEKGREIVFNPRVSGNTIVNRTEKLTLTRSDGKYEIFDDKTRKRYIFRGKPENGAYKLAEIEDETGEHRIVLEYNDNLYLRGITDTAGRYFEITTSETGQITNVRYDERVLVRYAYDEYQNLIEVTDASSVNAKFYYENHLLVKRITKFGDTFEWEYDGTDDNAMCTHTWGTDGLLEYWFEYNDDHTVLTNSLKNKSYYYFDEKKRLTRYIDANNAETLYEYNEYGEVLSVTAPDGEITKFAYDSAGKITEVTYPNGGKQTYEYDWKSRVIKRTAPNGAETQLGRDAKGRLVKVTIPTGMEILYTYDKNGMVSSIIEGVGKNKRVTEYGYDAELNLSEIKYPNGGTRTREYDKHGNCVKAVNPLGAAEDMEYDAANNLVKHTAIDGNVTQLSYNAYGDLILFKDNNREVSYAYTPLRDLASRKEQNRIVNMVYDTEGKLSYVENEAHEKYIFDRDGAGRIISEMGYDNVTKSYKYSPGGKPTGIKRGETSGFTEMKYGADGKLTEIQYDNGETETFAYGKMGELLAAENKNSKLEFEYDIIGRLIKETQNGYVIESKYSDEYIRDGRVMLKTSLGLNVDIDLNQFGQAEEINASLQGGFQYQSNLSYNLLGQETQRAIKTAGGGRIVDAWDYDKLGRPLSQGVSVNDIERRRRQYNWEIGDKLESIIDSVENLSIEYSYDSFGIPEAEKIQGTKLPSDGLTIIRRLGDTGNVFETMSETDRDYGNGGQLRSAKGRRYRYNDSGDLVEKREANDSIWKYFYHLNGLLEKVVRPDRKEVSFVYDPLGRRVSKEFDGKTTKFLWDGNKIIHEWTEETKTQTDGRPVKVSAWLFEEMSFTPLAKLANDQVYSVISNHLGTPNTMLNQKGEVVWKTELDMFGRPFWQESGNATEERCPFRFPGQYHDLETNLYYNRVRYYDPETGQYTQQDPIGLVGNNPTLYGHVRNPLMQVDLFGLIGARSRQSGPNIPEGITDGKSTGEGGGGITNPAVQRAYDRVPQDQRSEYHGKCAEAEFMSNAANAAGVKTDEELKLMNQGSESAAFRNDEKGKPMTACSSCAAVQEEQGIKDSHGKGHDSR